MNGFADRAYAIKERTIIMERLNKKITEERELELLYMLYEERGYSHEDAKDLMENDILHDFITCNGYEYNGKNLTVFHYLDYTSDADSYAIDMDGNIYDVTYTDKSGTPKLELLHK